MTVLDPRRQLTAVECHLKDACDRLGEALASLETEGGTVSRDSLVEAMHGHTLAALGHVWGARWEIITSMDETGGAQ